MFIQADEIFLTCYNNEVPNWKRITHSDLVEDRSLNRIIKSIGNFILEYNLDPKKLVDSIIKFYFDKRGRYPNIFLFKGKLALSIYKNSKLGGTLDLSKLQKILISVKKTKFLLKKLEVNGIIYSKGVFSLQVTGKADPYFLLAHGISQGIPKQIITEWEGNDELKKLVLDVIFD